MRGTLVVAMLMASGTAAASPSVAGGVSMSMDGRDNPATNVLSYTGGVLEVRVDRDSSLRTRLPVTLGTIQGDETSGWDGSIGLGIDWLWRCGSSGKEEAPPRTCLGMGIEAAALYQAYDFKLDQSVSFNALLVEPSLFYERSLGETRTLELRFGPRVKSISDEKYMDRGVSFGVSVRASITQTF
jgi:hypothetical protein